MDLEKLKELYSFDRSVIYDLIRGLTRRAEYKEALTYAMREDVRIAHSLVKDYMNLNHECEWFLKEMSHTSNNLPDLIDHGTSTLPSLQDLYSNTLVGKDGRFSKLNALKYERRVFVHGVHIPLFWSRDYARSFACDLVDFFIPYFEQQYPECTFPRKVIETVRRYIANALLPGEEYPYDMAGNFLNEQAKLEEPCMTIFQMARLTQAGSSATACVRVTQLLASDLSETQVYKDQYENMQRLLVSYYLGEQTLNRQEIPSLI